MAAWATPKQAPKPQMRAIIAEEREVAGDAELREALAKIIERVLQDRMPLLSMLQAQPLQVQSSHLSFQEYFAARAICTGARLPGPPWRWSAWWRNTLMLGSELGDDFGVGLLRAAGCDASHLDLKGKAGAGDRPSGARAEDWPALDVISARWLLA